MELWDNNFYDLRNKYIIPISAYRGDYKKANYNNIKQIFSNGFNSLTHITGSHFELEFDADKFYKSLINDIEFFYTRGIAQLVDVVNSTTQSNAWRFVTQYYFSFFSVTALFRILRFGFIFFSKQETEDFNMMATLILKSKIQINTGNYFFKYKRTETNGNLIFDFNNVGEGVHKKTWNEVSNLITDFYFSSDNDEKTILAVLKRMCKDYKPDFPSETRNSINYNGQFGIKSITNEFRFADTILPKSKYIKEVMSYKVSMDIEKKAEDVGLFGYYFFLMTTDLLKDYYMRSHIKSDFFKKRSEYLEKHKITIED